MSASPLSERFGSAFVTGASSGLGLAFSEMLLAEGLQVWGTSRDPARLARLAQHPHFHCVMLDLSRPRDAEQAFLAASQEAGGSFDVVIQGAGYGLFSPFASTDAQRWESQLQDMILSVARLSHAAFSAMRRNNRGTLVHVSSLAVEFPLPYMSGYNMAKAALSALSESLMMEARGSALCVVDFRPGDYRTAFNAAMEHSSAGAAMDERVNRAWRRLEQNLARAPLPEKAARDLRRALARGSSGIVRSGSFFQSRLAPLLASLVPACLRRAGSALYFGID